MEVHKEKIRWFRCVESIDDGICCLTYGKLYPATTVDREGDLAVVDDYGRPHWVVITESYKTKRGRTKGRIIRLFEEVTTDD